MNKNKLNFILFSEFKNCIPYFTSKDLKDKDGIWDSIIRYEGLPENITCFLTGKNHMSNVNGEQIVFFIDDNSGVGHIHDALDPNIFIFKKQLCDIIE